MDAADLAAIEQRITRRQAIDFDDAEMLIEEIKRLREALLVYTDATSVLSYGYEQDRDIGGMARQALGYGDHEPVCRWPNDNEACTCGLQDRIRADFSVKPQ